MPKELALALVDLERDEALATVKSRAESGEDPLRILGDCRQGMTIVGERYQQGDYYLAEMMLAAEIFKAATTELQPYLAKTQPAKPLGKVVLATMKGDIHDLGKNILSALLTAQGFEVHDLGVDVAPAAVIEKVREVRPEFVGFSALITSAFASMKETTEMLQEAGLRDHVKVMVGGGVTTPIVKDHIGADFQTTDAAEGLAYCARLAGGK